MARPAERLPRGAWALLGGLLLCSASALALPVVPAGRRCELAGRWVNELGSRLSISPTDAAGRFSGSFLSAVSASDGTPARAGLTGLQQRRAQPAFAFAVKWDAAGSVAVFVGQCFLDGGGAEMLETTWMLRREAATHADDWQATVVGKNVFVRVK